MRSRRVAAKECSQANPLLERRGGRDIKKNGAKPPSMERTGWSLTRHVRKRF